MSKKPSDHPKSWPVGTKYIPDYEYKSKDLVKLHSINSDECRFTQHELSTMPEVSVKSSYRKDNIRITSLKDHKSHPAYPQFGLFANKNFVANEFVVPYYGFVTSENEASESSDYVLRMKCLAIDGGAMGNEGRFVNDFRGITEKPNVEFREYINTDKMRVEMGIFVASGKTTIKKKTEICISYGKGFWKSRGIQL